MHVLMCFKGLTVVKFSNPPDERVTAAEPNHQATLRGNTYIQLYTYHICI